MINLLKEAAKMYAIGSASKEDVVQGVEHILCIHLKFEALPEEFHALVREFQIKQLIEELDLTSTYLTIDECVQMLMYGFVVED